jgi:hypothetical protein
MKYRTYLATFFFISLFFSVSLYSTEKIRSTDAGISLSIDKSDFGETEYFKTFQFALAPNISFKNSVKAEYSEKFANNSKPADSMLTILKKISQTTDITKLGSYRGIDIYSISIPQFIFDKAGLIKTISGIEIEIVYSQPLDSNYKYDSRELEPISTVLNKSYLGNIKYLSEAIKNASNFSKKAPDAFDWYNKNKRYIRFNTNSDDVYYVNAKDIIALEPGFLNQPKYNFRFYNRGREYPIYLGDMGLPFKGTDTLLFFGSRAKGDTTYYNAYDTTEAFYLTYDVADQRSQPFLNFPPANEIFPTDTVKSVTMNFHFETDSLYNEGYTLEYNENVSGEGWYYKSIIPKKDSVLKVPFVLYPTTGSTVKVKTTFFDRDFLRDASIIHQVYSSINSYNTYIDEIPYIPNNYYKTLQRTALSDNIFAGNNELEYTSAGVIPNGQAGLDNDELAYDFTEISAQTIPFANNDKSQFNTANLNKDCYLRTYPFSSPNIIAIDTINHYIYNPKVQKGSLLSASTNGEHSQWLSQFTFNNTKYSSTNAPGYHIYFYKLEDQTIAISDYTEDAFDSFIDKLKSLPTSGYAFVTINITKTLPPTLISTLSGYGAKKLDQYSPLQAWTSIINPSKKVMQEDLSDHISNSTIFIPNENAKTYCAEIPLAKFRAYSFIFVESKKVLQSRIESVNNSELTNQETQADLVIISSRIFENEAEEFLKYKQDSRKDLKTTLAFVEDIYKEFNFGIKSPHAIKSYLKYAYDNWKETALKYALLLGDASWDPKNIRTYSIFKDYVPTYGIPISDYWYGLLDESNDNIADVAIGRIPIKNKSDADNYLNKLKEYDNAENAPWQSSFLFLSAGANEYERINMISFTNGQIDIHKNSKYCNSQLLIQKSPVQGSQPNYDDAPKIIDAINKGSMWTFYMGHGSPDYFEMDGWTPDNFSNKGKYGLLSMASCNTGFFALSDVNSRLEKYLFVKDKAFIACIGASSVDNIALGAVINQNISRGIDSNFRNPLEMLNNSKIRLLGMPLYNSNNYVRLLNFLGDPTLRLPIDTLPNYYALKSEINLKSKNNESTIFETDKFAKLSLRIRNSGVKFNGAAPVFIIDEFDGKQDTVKVNFMDVCSELNDSIMINIENKPGAHKLIITIDPEYATPEKNKSNNNYVLYFDVLKAGYLSLDPMPHYNVNSEKPHFRVMDPFPASANYSPYFEIIEENSPNEPIAKSNPNEILKIEGALDWKPSLKLDSTKSYSFVTYYIKPGETEKSGVTYTPFFASSADILKKTEFKLFRNDLSALEIKGLTFNDKNQSLQYSTDSSEYSLISIRGGFKNPSGENVYKGSFLKVDGIYYKTTPPDNYGCYVMRFDKSFKHIENKYYNTWSDMAEENARYDSTGIQMIRYLRDSINTDDVIFISTLGSSLRLFAVHEKYGTEGSWDTLKAVLESYGAKKVKEIDDFHKSQENDILNISYSFLANKSATNKMCFESYSLSGDTAKLEGKYPKYASDASVSYKVTSLDSLLRVKVAAADLLKNNTVRTRIYAWNNEYPNETMIADTSGVEDFYTLHLAQNQNYRIEHIFNSKIPEPATLSIASLSAEVAPTTETTLSPINMPYVGEIYNGSIYFSKFQIHNLSIRRTAKKVRYGIGIDNINDVYEKVFNQIKPDAIVNDSLEITTDDYPLNIKLNGEIKTLDGFDRYIYNNKYSFNQSFIKDAEKPQIFLELDGNPVNDGDYIPIRPTFRAYVKDNSPKVIAEASKIKAKLNVSTWTSANTENYKFTSYPKGSDIKAELTFLPDSLPFDDNFIRIIAEDANNNIDTLLYKVIVSRKGRVKQFEIFPNPLKVKATIEFNYAAPAQGGVAEIEIFNYSGTRINVYDYPLHIGKNNIELIISDENGAQLPTGVYFYRMSVKNTDVYVEPLIDKFIIAR